MSKKKTLKSIFILPIIVMGLILFIYAIFGNPVEAVNKHKFKENILNINSSVVTLNELTPFEWEALYTFEPYASKVEMENKMGIYGTNIQETVSEGMVQLIFVKDGKVISEICGLKENLGYSIDIPVNEEGFRVIFYKDRLLFDVSKENEKIVLSLTE